MARKIGSNEKLSSKYALRNLIQQQTTIRKKPSRKFYENVFVHFKTTFSAFCVLPFIACREERSKKHLTYGHLARSFSRWQYLPCIHGELFCEKLLSWTALSSQDSIRVGSRRFTWYGVPPRTIAGKPRSPGELVVLARIHLTFKANHFVPTWCSWRFLTSAGDVHQVPTLLMKLVPV